MAARRQSLCAAMPGFFARRRARGHSPHVSKECGSRADADLVIDLHCDREAVAHLYTTPGAPAAVTFELRDVSHELAARHPGDRRQCEGAARATCSCPEPLRRRHDAVRRASLLVVASHRPS